MPEEWRLFKGGVYVTFARYKVKEIFLILNAVWHLLQVKLNVIVIDIIQPLLKKQLEISKKHNSRGVDCDRKTLALAESLLLVSLLFVLLESLKMKKVTKIKK